MNATESQSGIQRSPATAVPRNAARKLQRSQSQVASGGAMAARSRVRAGIASAKARQLRQSRRGALTRRPRRVRPPPAEIAHRLLYAGRFVDCKGILPFLDVLRKWGQDHPDRTVDFDFVGEGPQEAEIAGFAMPQNVRLFSLGMYAISKPFEWGTGETWYSSTVRVPSE